MIARQSQRLALALAALLVAGVSLDAPVAFAASPQHAPVANRFVVPKEQLHEVYRFVVPHSLEAPSQIDNPFADTHQE